MPACFLTHFVFYHTIEDFEDYQPGKYYPISIATLLTKDDTEEKGQILGLFINSASDSQDDARFALTIPGCRDGQFPKTPTPKLLIIS